jgi:hypothetical protein
MYDQVSPTVHLYAPEGPDHLQHIDRINSYNNRADNPTNWNTIIYTGDDFFEKMLEEKRVMWLFFQGITGKKQNISAGRLMQGLMSWQINRL